VVNNKAEDIGDSWTFFSLSSKTKNPALTMKSGIFGFVVPFGTLSVGRKG
jgi:hypothetical protein